MCGLDAWGDIKVVMAEDKIKELPALQERYNMMLLRLGYMEILFC